MSDSIEQQPRVRLRQLGKTFVGDDQNFTAVEAVDLDIGRDDFFCLLGPSGCGKTTILNILAGFEQATEGAAEFQGAEVREPSRDRGVVFQADNSLYDWLTARQNVEFGLRLAGMDQKEKWRSSRPGKVGKDL